MLVTVVWTDGRLAPCPAVPRAACARVGRGVACPVLAAVVRTLGDVVAGVESLEDVVTVAVEVDEHLQGGRNIGLNA